MDKMARMGKMRIPPLSSVGDLLKLYRISAKKQLSQNFLLDPKLSSKLVTRIGILKDSHVIEVGPGPGSLTRALMPFCPQRIIAIEKDKRFKAILEMLGEAFSGSGRTMTIVYDDIRNINLGMFFNETHKRNWDDKDCPNIYVIGNLPFSVSTNLIIRYLKDISERANVWSMGRVKMCFTFQKEVADRIVAEADTPDRCRLSIMCQTWTHPKYEFTINGHTFIPRPKVDVGVVTFEPRITPQTNHEFKFFEKITRHMYSFRRKQCLRAVKTLFPSYFEENLAMKMCNIADIDPTMRPFMFTVEDIDKLCSAYKSIIQMHPEVESYNYRASKRVLPRKYTIHKQISETADDGTEAKLIEGLPLEDYLLASPRHLLGS